MTEMQHDAAKRWDAREDDAPSQQPMRAGLKPAERKAPSQDQKKVRREMARKAASLTCVACGCASTQGPCTACGSLLVTATQAETSLARSDGTILVNPGDTFRLPTGQTTRIRNIRRHETSGDHYYVDTDLGTTVMPYSTRLTLVPQDSRQQSVPSYGDPRGNSNTLPGNPQYSSPGEANIASQCPVCGGSSMTQRGSKAVCNQCGYSASAQGGMAFGDSPQMIQDPRRVRSSLQAPLSAVARRAAEVYDQMKENPL